MFVLGVDVGRTRRERVNVLHVRLPSLNLNLKAPYGYQSEGYRQHIIRVQEVSEYDTHIPSF